MGDLEPAMQASLDGNEEAIIFRNGAGSSCLCDGMARHCIG